RPSPLILRTGAGALQNAEASRTLSRVRVMPSPIRRWVRTLPSSEEDMGGRRRFLAALGGLAGGLAWAERSRGNEQDEQRIEVSGARALKFGAPIIIGIHSPPVVYL